MIFCALDSSEKAIAILRGRWCHRRPNNTWKKRTERPNVGVGVRMVPRLKKDAWSMVNRPRQATNEYASPAPPPEVTRQDKGEGVGESAGEGRGRDTIV